MSITPINKAEIGMDEHGNVFVADGAGKKWHPVGAKMPYADYGGAAIGTTSGNGANFSVGYNDNPGATPLLDTDRKSALVEGFYFVDLRINPELPLDDDLSVFPEFVLQLSAPDKSYSSTVTLDSGRSVLVSSTRGKTVSRVTMGHIGVDFASFNPQILRGDDGAGSLDFYFEARLVKLS